MPEGANAGEHHRHALLIADRDRFLIAGAAAGLNDCRDAGLQRVIDDRLIAPQPVEPLARVLRATIDGLIEGLRAR